MPDNIHYELVEWADKFLELAIWKNISDSDNFCIQHESWKEPAFISIMGNAGIIYGISIWRGVKSYKLLEGLRNSDIDMDTAFIEGDVMCVDKSRDSEISSELKSYLAKYGCNMKRNELPLIYVSPVHGRIRPPANDDAAYILICIKTIVRLSASGRLKPDRFKKENSLLTFFVKDDNKTIEEKYVVYGADVELSKTVKLSPEEISSLRSLGRNNSTYLISYFVGPFSVQERMMRVLLVHDRNKDKILSTDPFEATDSFENIIKKLVEVFKGNNAMGKKGLPKQIITDSKHFYDSSKRYLAGLGIKVICSERVPKLDEVRNSMARFMRKK